MRTETDPVDEATLERVSRMLCNIEMLQQPDRWITASEDMQRLDLEKYPDDVVQHWHDCLVSLIDQQPTRFLTWCCEEYPASLLKTDTAPALLFMRGVPYDDKRPAAAIVGSRKASDQAEHDAFCLAFELAENGFNIVSGLAEGIDTAAHKGALEIDGLTTAVLGTGIDQHYPHRNVKLQDEISERGTLISQFPPGQSPSKTSFPARNAVVAGLADVSVVMEAGIRSGTRIEMNYALSFGKPVALWEPTMQRESWAKQLANVNDNVYWVQEAEHVHKLATNSYQEE